MPIIKSAEIKSLYKIWRKKPMSLSLNDTDAIIVKAADGKHKIQKTFFTCIKPDGTFELKTVDRSSKARRMELAKFLVKNKFAKMKNVESYNLKEKITEWPGKNVEF